MAGRTWSERTLIHESIIEENITMSCKRRSCFFRARISSWGFVGCTQGTDNVCIEASSRSLGLLRKVACIPCPADHWFSGGSERSYCWYPTSSCCGTQGHAIPGYWCLSDNSTERRARITSARAQCVNAYIHLACSVLERQTANTWTKKQDRKRSPQLVHVRTIMGVPTGKRCS